VLRWLPTGDALAWRELPIEPGQVVGLQFDRGRHYQMRDESGVLSGRSLSRFRCGTFRLSL